MLWWSDIPVPILNKMWGEQNEIKTYIFLLGNSADKCFCL